MIAAALAAYFSRPSKQQGGELTQRRSDDHAEISQQSSKRAHIDAIDAALSKWAIMGGPPEHLVSALVELDQALMFAPAKDLLARLSQRLQNEHEPEPLRALCAVLLASYGGPEERQILVTACNDPATWLPYFAARALCLRQSNASVRTAGFWEGCIREIAARMSPDPQFEERLRRKYEQHVGTERRGPEVYLDSFEDRLKDPIACSLVAAQLRGLRRGAADADLAAVLFGPECPELLRSLARDIALDSERVGKARQRALSSLESTGDPDIGSLATAILNVELSGARSDAWVMESAIAVLQRQSPDALYGPEGMGLMQSYLDRTAHHKDRDLLHGNVVTRLAASEHVHLAQLLLESVARGQFGESCAALAISAMSCHARTEAIFEGRWGFLVSCLESAPANVVPAVIASLERLAGNSAEGSRRQRVRQSSDAVLRLLESRERTTPGLSTPETSRAIQGLRKSLQP